MIDSGKQANDMCEIDLSDYQRQILKGHLVWIPEFISEIIYAECRYEESSVVTVNFNLAPEEPDSLHFYMTLGPEFPNSRRIEFMSVIDVNSAEVVRQLAHMSFVHHCEAELCSGMTFEVSPELLEQGWGATLLTGYAPLDEEYFPGSIHTSDFGDVTILYVTLLTLEEFSVKKEEGIDGLFEYWNANEVDVFSSRRAQR